MLDGLLGGVGGWVGGWVGRVGGSRWPFANYQSLVKSISIWEEIARPSNFLYAST